MKLRTVTQVTVDVVVPVILGQGGRQFPEAGPDIALEPVRSPAGAAR